MEIIKFSETDTQIMELVSSFYQAYQDRPNRKNLILKSSLLNLSQEDSNPDKLAPIIIRVCIERGRKITEDQKYVIGLRFYSFGDIATIDLLSFNYPNHEDIAYHHLLNFNKHGRNENIGEFTLDKFKETLNAPFMLTGGHLKLEEKKKLNFFGASGDYEDHLSAINNNDLAAFLISTVQYSKSNNRNILAGKTFIQNILEIMKENKFQTNFYEQILSKINKGLPAKLSIQQLSALMVMKDNDQALLKDENSYLLWPKN